MALKRKPRIATPGPILSPNLPNDDFTLTAALYFDSIEHYAAAREAELRGDTQLCDRYKRSSVLAALSFFEAQLNSLAFSYAAARKEDLGQIELDALEEMETQLDDRGDIVRKSKFYRTESRFCLLAYILSGKDFDRGGSLWQRFGDARKIRDRWTHPKPPFDTWSLELKNVRDAIVVVYDMYQKLAELMDSNLPAWMRPVDEILNEIEQNAG